MRAAAELWTGYTDTITAGLRDVIVTDGAGTSIPAQDGIAQWVAMTHAVRRRDGQLFIIGNGWSAAMASHMVTDAIALAHLRANALNDPTMLTAAANDLSFEQTFTLQLEHLARPESAHQVVLHYWFDQHLDHPGQGAV